MIKLLSVALVLATSTAIASGSIARTGAGLTLGPSSSHFSLSAAKHNPGLNALLLADGKSMRMGYLPSFGFAVEAGPVDNFADDLEELADIIDDPSSTDEDASSILDRFNDVLLRAGEDGYVRVVGQAQSPATPWYFHSEKLKGTVGIDLSLASVVGLSILDSELSFDNQNDSFSTATSLYIKSGVEATIAVSYGREIFDHLWGQLHAGIKTKYITLDLSKQVLPIVQLANAELSDLIRDEYDKNQNRSDDFSIDLGLVWDAPNYRLGLTFEDLNSPEFEFGEVGINCGTLAENTSPRSNCEAARFFSEVRGEIAQREVHKKDAKARLDSLFTLGDGVYVSAAVDLTKYNDFVGAQHQWLHAGIDYQIKWLFLSSLRAGYHANLVGSKISSAALGFTLFDIVNLDFEYGLKDVVVDGTTTPRRLGFALNIEAQF